MRLIFAGSPDFAVPSLLALAEAGHDIAAVYTQPDRPAGRGRKLTASPVKQAAERLGIAVYQPLSLKDEAAIDELAALNADAMVVAAYGLLLPQAVLDAPRLGCINVHASLLPRWRGAAPIQRAIEAGDDESGVTIMQMALGLDSGDMLAKVTVPIGAETTGASLHDALATAGASLLTEVMADLPGFQNDAEVQDDSLANYARKLAKADGALDWSENRHVLDCRIRAFDPWPGCHTQLDGKTLRIWAASPSALGGPEVAAAGSQAGTIVAADQQGIHLRCGDGLLCITELQPPGKRRMSAADFARNHSLVGVQAS